MFDEVKKYKLLDLINELHQRPKVEKPMKSGKSTIKRYCDRLEGDELIKRRHDSNPIWYNLTDTGKMELERFRAIFSQGAEDSQLSLAESEHQIVWLLHQITWKYPIIEDCPIHMNVEVPMKNWIKQIDEWKVCSVTKTTKNLIIHAKELHGTNPYELIDRARNISDTMINIYEGAYGMKFGRPIRVGKPHYETNDPICQQFAKHFTIKYNDGLSTTAIDASRLGGEISYDNPEDAVEYIRMPKRVKRIEGSVKTVTSDLESLHEKVEILRANDHVIGEGIELILDKMHLKHPKETYQPQKERKQEGIEYQ